MGKIVTKGNSLAGKKVILHEAELFRDSTYPASHKALTGTYFLYDGALVNERYAIVASRANVEFKPSVMVIIGYISKDNITEGTSEGVSKQQ